MNPSYKVGDRVSFISRDEYTCRDKCIKHYIGYITQVRRTFFRGIRYVVCIAKSDEVRIVPERDILGKMEKREKQKNNE